MSSSVEKQAELAKATFKIATLLHLCREGDFYTDYDESMQALREAEEAFSFIVDLAVVGAGYDVH